MSDVAVIVGRHRRKIVGAALLGLVAAAAGLAQPIAIGLLVAAVVAGRSLVEPILLVVLLFAVDIAFSALQAYVSGRSGERIVFDARRMLARRMLFADLAAFRRLRQGDALTGMVNDTSLLKVALAQSLATIAVDGLMLLGGMVLMFIIDPLLFSLTIGCLALTSIVSLALARQLRRAALRTREIVGEFGADLHRVLGALPTVKASRAERWEAERLDGVAERARQAGTHMSLLNALLSPAMSIGVQASLALVIVTGMGRVANGTLDPGTLTAFVMYLFYLVAPLIAVFMGIGQLQQARAAAARINNFAAVAQEPAGDEPAATPRLANPDGRAGGGVTVEFDRVSYGYSRDQLALCDVSFRARRGLTAVVGPSGAGKTTLFELLMRFYPVGSGRIRLDGEDIATIPLATLRGLVGYVRQESTAMRGTIRENLTYAARDATADQIDRALSLTGLQELVRSLPSGLETDLGDGGVGLSGGQCQRLAIARMLIAQPAVLVLDEATSQLDSESELAVRTSVREIAAHCTVICVAHRMSTVVDADQIVVLDAGRVRAVGTHEELLRDSELYRRLADIQFRTGSPPPASPAELVAEPAPLAGG